MNADHNTEYAGAYRKVSVGLSVVKTADIVFNGIYFLGGESYSGHHLFSSATLPLGDNIFEPADETSSFSVTDIIIGKEFHWQRRQTQTFRGAMLLRVSAQDMEIINILPVEDYLESVVSSEMSADSYPEFLKAHAVISRSWLAAQIEKSRTNETVIQDMTETRQMRVRWYDNTGHKGFDVCADDHCQRYQGIGGITESARNAVRATKGKILVFNGEICDARFSKCCGGALETFENCWQNTRKAYLRPGRDILPDKCLPDLTEEENAKRWILGRPDAFCAFPGRHILKRVLKDYDKETKDFFRWVAEYSGEELSRIVRQRSGIDFGEIADLIALERGPSGRISLLRIVGTLRTMDIGKELEIRRTLSVSHLYSSAFIVERDGFDSRGIPSLFRLKGAGWGHGVGLCQIGAAVMASKGFSCSEILSHYYPGSEIATI